MILSARCARSKDHDAPQGGASPAIRRPPRRAGPLVLVDELLHRAASNRAELAHGIADRKDGVNARTPAQAERRRLPSRTTYAVSSASCRGQRQHHVLRQDRSTSQPCGWAWDRPRTPSSSRVQPGRTSSPSIADGRIAMHADPFEQHPPSKVAPDFYHYG